MAAWATGGVGAGAVLAHQLGMGVACPFLAVTGVPCPGCGMTRLAATIAAGDPLTAATIDPAGCALLVLIVVVAAAPFVRAVRGLRARAGPATRERVLDSARVPTVSALLLGAHWITTLATGGFVR